MNNERRISVNALPAYIKAMLIAFMFIGCLLVDRNLDLDFYFLYSFGRSIVHDGFPVKDVLSMHTDMNIIVQQWLTDVLFYRTYELWGKAGVIAIAYAVLAAYTVLMYRLCKIVTGNFFVSMSAAQISGMLVAIYIVTRPQIFTYLNFVLLLLFLEKYVKTEKAWWLCPLPLISCLQINIHASMWLMLFVLMMPYVVSCVNIKLPRYQSPARCKAAHLAAAMVAMVAAAFLNPYGHKALLYLFGSYGVNTINQNIQEMQVTSIADANGKLYLGLLFLAAAVPMLCRRRKPELRFICLALGTAVLGLTSYKANVYFYIVGFVCAAHYFKDFDFRLKITANKRSKKEKIQLVVLIILLVLALVYLFFGQPEAKEDSIDQEIEHLSLAADYLDTQNRDEMVLYAGFNEGSYLEFRGYRPYLDGRAELFLEAKNGQFDYFNEFIRLNNGVLYYKDFLDKYGFTHILVPTEGNYLYISLIHDADYQAAYTNEYYTVFTKA